ncbi:phage tail length tape measure family protein [Proteus faecis]|uniref:phage tail length tape measure family protein n=1 Tax=Proteus faecis TaxID=2050967 RepID=UPI003075C952
MSQQIADLTINLSADTVEFGQQMGRVERQLQETAEKAEASQRRMAQLVEQQAQSARSSAESTAQSLQELNNQQEISQQQRADYYQRIAQEEARAAIESRKQADAFLEQAQSVGQTRNALEQLTEVLNKSTKAYDKLKITGEQFAEIQNVTKSRIKAIQDQQDANTEKYYKQIEAVKGLSGSASALRAIQAQLNQEVEKGTIHQRDYQVLISAITSESMKLRREEESLTQQKTRFIQRLKEQVATQNLSREQMLRYQASQLGVSSSAEIYIRRLSESNKEIKEFDKNSKSLSGRLQGIANSFNMGSLVRGGIWGGITAGLTGVAKLAYDVEREFSQFNKQLILTGNYANKSASQLNEMARTLAGGGITRGEMASSISSVVGTGVFSNNEISRVSKAVAQMNYITGQTIDTTIDQFKRLQDEPLQMSLELEKANHHLTASQLEQIRTLELQGNKTEAARLAIDAYAQSINDGANDIVENLGYLESAWLGIKNTAKKGWDAMLNIGRTETLNDQIREQESLLKSLSNIVITPQYRLDEIKAKIATLKEQVSDIDLKNAQKQA